MKKLAIVDDSKDLMKTVLKRITHNARYGRKFKK